MPDYTEVGLGMSNNGDLVLSSSGDLKISDAKRTLEQNILFRALTDFADFYLHPNFGANLSELIGEPNTRKNAETGQENLFTVLTQDGLVDATDLKISAVPIEKHRLIYAIFVMTTAGELRVTPLIFNFNQGLTLIQK